MHLTTKQIQLMTVIATGNKDDSFCDLDEILDRLPYETSKQSLQFSIRALIAKRLIYKHGNIKRRGRQRVIIACTTLGHDTIGIGRKFNHLVAEPDTSSVSGPIDFSLDELK